VIGHHCHIPVTAGGCVLEGAAHKVIVERIEQVVLAEEFVVAITLVLRVLVGNTASQVVRDRHIDDTGHFAVIVVAQLNFNRSFQLIAWSVAGDIECAASGVATE